MKWEFSVILVIFGAHGCFLASPEVTEPNHYLTFSHRLKRQSCSGATFKCSNGECVESYSLCDGAKDCSDGSDETRQVCGATRCPALAFVCAYGACVEREARCNGRADCADGSDERGCDDSAATSPSSCGFREYQCKNGQCVDQYSKCDGTLDCNDGSDETKILCKNIRCPSSSFQCAYGACMEQSVKCNGRRDCPDGSDEAGCRGSPVPVPDRPPPTARPDAVGSCRLPEHPRHGAYTSTIQCQAGDNRPACRNTPGSPVPSGWVLKYSCNRGYDLSSTDVDYSLCESGVWKIRLDCIKLCQPLQSLSVNVRCMYNGQEVSCDKPMKPKTTAYVKCKLYYHHAFTPDYSSIECQDDGEWNYRLYYCTPDCGVSIESGSFVPLILNGMMTKQGEFPWLAALYLKNPGNSHWEQKCAGTLITSHIVLTDCGITGNVDPLIVGGLQTKKAGEFPWLTALYMKEENRWEQQCGGTMISPHIVLTAAHCLVDTMTGGPRRPEDVKVGLGKYYRDYYRNEEYSILADVSEIVVPRLYSGAATNYAVDIGLIDLKTSVQVTAFIMPACVEWGTTVTVQPGEIGHVAGWGTTENQTSSETVLSANLEYIDAPSCILKLRPVYQRLVTHDKFCAGSINGSQVDKGDSGGGLTFVKSGQHFVFGVVSTKIKIEEQILFTLFTDVANTEHHLWLEEQRIRLNKKHKEY